MSFDHLPDISGSLLVLPFAHRVEDGFGLTRTDTSPAVEVAIVHDGSDRGIGEADQAGASDLPQARARLGPQRGRGDRIRRRGDAGGGPGRALIVGRGGRQAGARDRLHAALRRGVRPYRALELPLSPDLLAHAPRRVGRRSARARPRHWRDRGVAQLRELACRAAFRNACRFGCTLAYQRVRYRRSRAPAARGDRQPSLADAPRADRARTIDGDAARLAEVADALDALLLLHDSTITLQA